MQGKKTLQPKLFSSFNLADRVPEDNFYRRLKDILDLHFLYKETKPFYGSCGQKSLDPTVFFRLCLVGYLENITSDRQLIRHAAMRLDILYFIDHDIDDELPWHSTISRTQHPKRLGGPANKQFIMAAVAYNLREYLKFDPKIPQAPALAGPLAIQEPLKSLKSFLLSISREFFSPLELSAPDPTLILPIDRSATY